MSSTYPSTDQKCFRVAMTADKLRIFTINKDDWFDANITSNYGWHYVPIGLRDNVREEYSFWFEDYAEAMIFQLKWG